VWYAVVPKKNFHGNFGDCSDKIRTFAPTNTEASRLQPTCRRKTNNESCKAPRTLQTEGLNFCNQIMSDLNKKVNQAIKLLKLAEESAVQKSIERERERSNQ
jgi:hypothetical protein